MLEKWANTILNDTIPYCMHNSSVFCIQKVFYPPLKNLTNIYRFSWKRVKFELRVLHSLLMFFFQKSFLDTQVSISS
jgi:hypothetical protein